MSLGLGQLLAYSGRDGTVFDGPRKGSDAIRTVRITSNLTVPAGGEVEDTGVQSHSQAHDSQRPSRSSPTRDATPLIGLGLAVLGPDPLANDDCGVCSKIDMLRCLRPGDGFIHLLIATQ